jgi:hypothetical protein
MGSSIPSVATRFRGIPGHRPRGVYGPKQPVQPEQPDDEGDHLGSTEGVLQQPP